MAEPRHRAEPQDAGSPTGEPGSDPDTRPGTMPDVGDEEREQIEAERQHRLDPANRPDNAEVDNTDREFDEVRGRFTDSEPPDQGEEEYDPSVE